VRRGYPPPPSLLAENAMQLPDTTVYRITSEGRGNMPGYASQIRARDRRAVVLSIRNMQAHASPVGESTP